MTTDQPNNTSSDHDAMRDYWAMVDAILGGAKSMRAAGETNLPKHKDEPKENYELRKKNAKFINVFRDITENLAQRPFGKQVTLGNDSGNKEFEDFAENVDSKGSSLHVFSADRFFAGINNGIDWILVDYTKDVPQGATVADEKRIGARPYWVHYPATSVLAAYSAQIEGDEQFIHVRLNEPQKKRVGFSEETVERVRVLERPELEGGGYGPAQFEIWEKQKDDKGKEDWVSVEGPTALSIGVIPLVPFLTGRRIGKSWRVHPPMQDAAYLQIELYQELSGLKHAKDLTCFPMLTASGVSPATDSNGNPVKVPVGPHAVLYAPTFDGVAGEWKFIEPGAQSLEFLAKDIKETIKELRELGRQPLTAQSGNLTVITTAVAAKKGNAAIQDWALSLKDALENAFKFTAMWLKVEGQEPSVNIDTDFDLGWDEQDGFDYLITMHDNGDISHAALINEAKRRNYLRPDFDAEEDIKQILNEMSGEDEGDAA